MSLTRGIGELKMDTLRSVSPAERQNRVVEKPSSGKFLYPSTSPVRYRDYPFAHGDPIAASVPPASKITAQ